MAVNTADLLIKVACFVKIKIKFSIEKSADLNLLDLEGQWYWAYPFSKESQLPSLSKNWLHWLLLEGWCQQDFFCITHLSSTDVENTIFV